MKAQAKTRSNGAATHGKKIATPRRGKKASGPTAVIHGLLDKYAAKDWMAFAALQRRRLIREVKTLGDEMLGKIAASPIFAQRDELIHEARHHLETILERLKSGSLVHRAMHSARETGSEILSFLNIPTQHELRALQKKLGKIETRVAALNDKRKSAAAEAASTAA